MKLISSNTRFSNFYNNQNLLLIVIFSFVISISSFHFEKTLKWQGLLVYYLTLCLFCVFLLRFKEDVLLLITKFKPNRLIVILLMILILSFVFWYPYESVRSIGTDRDEALNQSVHALLEFEYPYYERTIVNGKAHDLGLDNNPITVLPGSIIFALPFVLLGNSAYQSFFWILIFYWFLRVNLNSSSYALLFLIIIIFASPSFLFQILIGSDYVANSIWMLILVFSLLRNINRNKPSFVYLFSIALGIGTASRLHFTLILIPLFLYLILFNNSNRNFLNIKAIFTISVTFCIVTLPFLLYDFKSFTPIHYSNLFQYYGKQYTWVEYLLPAITVFISFVLPLFIKLNEDMLMMIMGLILFFPSFCLIGIQFISTGKLSFENTHYLLPFSLFSGLSIFRSVIKNNSTLKCHTISVGKN